MATGTAAAARGGYTTVCAMPNLNPVPDSAEHLAAELEAIRRGALIGVYPYGALTVGERGEAMSDIASLPLPWRPSPTTGAGCRAKA